LVTGIKMVTFPLWKPLVASTLKVSGHAKDMEAFYKYQKEGYDSFREGLLHARPALMEAFPLKKGGGMVWIDIGGGTARNLEFFSVRCLLVFAWLGPTLMCGCVVLRVTFLISRISSD
jgi:betaine lipid synthase